MDLYHVHLKGIDKFLYEKYKANSYFRCLLGALLSEFDLYNSSLLQKRLHLSLLLVGLGKVERNLLKSIEWMF